jgi:hypothetical protein
MEIIGNIGDEAMGKKTDIWIRSLKSLLPV